MTDQSAPQETETVESVLADNEAARSGKETKAERLARLYRMTD